MVSNKWTKHEVQVGRKSVRPHGRPNHHCELSPLYCVRDSRPHNAIARKSDAGNDCERFVRHRHSERHPRDISGARTSFVICENRCQLLVRWHAALTPTRSSFRFRMEVRCRPPGYVRVCPVAEVFPASRRTFDTLVQEAGRAFEQRLHGEVFGGEWSGIPRESHAPFSKIGGAERHVLRRMFGPAIVDELLATKLQGRNPPLLGMRIVKHSGRELYLLPSRKEHIARIVIA
jgi:hypothetical protein